MPATPRARPVSIARRAAPWSGLLLAGFAIAATGTARASGPADISLVQATGSADEPLPRPTIGAGALATPALPFRVSLTHHCPAGTARTELFVAIADTARLLEAGPPGEPQVVTVEVPMRQLQWLAQPAATCDTVSARRRPDEVGQDGLEYFRLHAGTAGYATVTCRDEKGAPSSATTSVPLDIWLACATAPADGPQGR